MTKCYRCFEIDTFGLAKSDPDCLACKAATNAKTKCFSCGEEIKDSVCVLGGETFCSTHTPEMLNKSLTKSTYASTSYLSVTEYRNYKTLYLDGSIEKETVMPIIDQIESTQQDILFYIKSGGGDSYLAQILLDCLEANKQRIVLIPTWTIQSSAFELCVKFSGRKRADMPFYGMCHLADLDISYRKDDEDRVQTDIMGFLAKTGLEFYNTLPFSQEEKEELKAGKNVYIGYQRMPDFLSAYGSLTTPIYYSSK